MTPGSIHGSTPLRGPRSRGLPGVGCTGLATGLGHDGPGAPCRGLALGVVQSVGAGWDTLSSTLERGAGSPTEALGG